MHTTVSPVQINVNHLQTFVAATEKHNDEYRLYCKSYLIKVHVIER